MIGVMQMMMLVLNIFQNVPGPYCKTLEGTLYVCVCVYYDEYVALLEIVNDTLHKHSKSLT